MLNGQRDFVQKDQIFELSPDLQTGDATTLFGLNLQFPHQLLLKQNADTLASHIATFLQNKIPETEKVPLKLGFIFGFPVDTTAIDRGKLLAWSKGFAVQDAIGKDIPKLLQDALNRKQLPVQCQAIVNDVRKQLTSNGPWLNTRW